MASFPIKLAILLGAGALWCAGLRLFLQSDLSRRRKMTWSTFLLLVGVGIGLVLPLNEIWNKFLLVVAILPVLAVADVLVLRFGRGLAFWMRACGFEVCTVFAAAGATRYLLDLVSVRCLFSGAC